MNPSDLPEKKSLLARSEELLSARYGEPDRGRYRGDGRAAWLRSRDRRRDLVSWGAAAVLYAAGFGVAFLAGTCSLVELGEYSGPIVVRLGSPEGAEQAMPEPAPEPEATPPAEETPPDIPPADAAQADIPAPAAAPTPSPAPAAPAPVAAKPAPKPSASSAAPAAVAPAQPAETTIVKGSESGNSYDMTVAGGGGTVGRSLYEPIWLYMPLPNKIPDSLYRTIPDYQGMPGTADRRRAAIAAVYELKNDTWVLKGDRQPGEADRPAVWAALEDAGYDIAKAEYKERAGLKPVIILFKVSGSKTGAKLEVAEILKGYGSGYSDIDDAVLFAFRRAQFSNTGDKSVSGRFTYRFE